MVKKKKFEDYNIQEITAIEKRMRTFKKRLDEVIHAWDNDNVAADWLPARWCELVELFWKLTDQV